MRCINYGRSYFTGPYYAHLKCFRKPVSQPLLGLSLKVTGKNKFKKIFKEDAKKTNYLSKINVFLGSYHKNTLFLHF